MQQASLRGVRSPQVCTLQGLLQCLLPNARSDTMCCCGRLASFEGTCVISMLCHDQPCLLCRCAQGPCSSEQTMEQQPLCLSPAPAAASSHRWCYVELTISSADMHHFTGEANASCVCDPCWLTLWPAFGECLTGSSFDRQRF